MDAVGCCGYCSLVLYCGIIMLREMLRDAVADVECCYIVCGHCRMLWIFVYAVTSSVNARAAPRILNGCGRTLWSSVE